MAASVLAFWACAIGSAVTLLTKASASAATKLMQVSTTSILVNVDSIFLAIVDYTLYR
jgi:hypothetical protein